MAEGEGQGRASLTQDELDALATSLDIRYAVLDNLSGGHATYQAVLTIANKGDTELCYGDWAIFFSHIRMIEPGRLPCQDGILLHEGLHLAHINGCLFRLKPTPSLKPLKKGDALTLPFSGQYYSVARSDVLPNWYLVAGELEPKVIDSTTGEGLDFVAPFDTPGKWKRFDYTVSSTQKRRYDYYDPFTPQDRFERNVVSGAEKGGKLVGVIPTPVSVTVDEGAEWVKFDARDWCVRYAADFIQEAEYLAEKLEAKCVAWDPNIPPGPKSIVLQKKDVSVVDGERRITNESYSLCVDSSPPQVTLCSGQASGIFYAVQTLLSLVEAGTLPPVKIRDAPRYSYRGMHLDVSRNFHSKESVLRLLEVMGMLKLNAFHFHLTDDEGWRIQIPGLEELTQVGGRRSHNYADNKALMPQLGSGPDSSSSGSGYFSVSEYREIVRFAAQRHIEVIPEIDMPGHCHAAIKAMQVRYHKLKASGDLKAAEEYLLSDLSAKVTGECQSVQMFSENSLNPGLPSTFTFIHKVMSEVKAMHRDIAPLRMFHLGGDEVPYEAWEESPACQALIDCGEVTAFKDLMQYFVVKVAEIAWELGLEVGAWQDGIVHKFEEPFPRHKFPNKRVAVYAWKNVWETGMASDVYKLANNDYQVILSAGTHLYFDHPQEPDPEERGLYWACRFTDTRKVFSLAPDNLFSNADVRLTGQPFTEEEVQALVQEQEATPLQKPHNIIGIQGQLWTELIRTPAQLDSMIHPRLSALAERAWHRASWEGLQRDDQRRQEEWERDWAGFSGALGAWHLSRLDRLGVHYYLPPPGARIKDSLLEMNCQFPGLPLEFSSDNGAHWTTYKQPVDVGRTRDFIAMRTCSTDGKRHSRVIKISLSTAESEQSVSR